MAAPRPRRSAARPASERADGVAEVAPEPVDADRGRPPGGMGDVADRGEQRRIDHRRPERRAGRRPPRKPRSRRDARPAQCQAPGPTCRAAISHLRPSRSDSAPGDELADAPDRWIDRGEQPICARLSPAAAKNSGKRPQAIPSLRLLTRPAWLTADRSRSRRTSVGRPPAATGSALGRAAPRRASPRARRGRASRARASDREQRARATTKTTPRKNGCWPQTVARRD